MQLNTLDALVQLYYAKALALYLLGQRSEALEYGVKCLSTCMIKENYRDLNFYYRLLLEDFGADPKSYLLREYSKFIKDS